MLLKSTQTVLSKLHEWSHFVNLLIHFPLNNRHTLKCKLILLKALKDWPPNDNMEKAKKRKRNEKETLTHG